MRAALPVQKEGPRINEEIRVREVHLIDKDGANKGTVAIAEAIRLAQEAGLDLVEISPNADPPVCKLLDFGKYKYAEQKKAAEARKKQKVVEVKEIKFRPMIDDHDYDVKMRSMARSLAALTSAPGSPQANGISKVWARARASSSLLARLGPTRRTAPKPTFASPRLA